MHVMFEMLLHKNQNSQDPLMKPKLVMENAVTMLVYAGVMLYVLGTVTAVMISTKCVKITWLKLHVQILAVI